MKFKIALLALSTLISANTFAVGFSCYFQDNRSRFEIEGVGENKPWVTNGWINYNYEERSDYIKISDFSYADITEDHIKVSMRNENHYLDFDLKKTVVTYLGCQTNHTRNPNCGVPMTKIQYIGPVRIQRDGLNPFLYEGPAQCDFHKTVKAL